MELQPVQNPEVSRESQYKLFGRGSPHIKLSLVEAAKHIWLAQGLHGKPKQGVTIVYYKQNVNIQHVTVISIVLRLNSELTTEALL